MLEAEAKTVEHSLSRVGYMKFTQKVNTGGSPRYEQELTLPVGILELSFVVDWCYLRVGGAIPMINCVRRLNHSGDWPRIIPH